MEEVEQEREQEGSYVPADAVIIETYIDCILCGHASGGRDYAICGECCELNAASEREILEAEKRNGPRLIAYGFVALLSFVAGVACGWMVM